MVNRKVISLNKVFEYVKRSKRSSKDDFIPNHSPCVMLHVAMKVNEEESTDTGRGRRTKLCICLSKT